MNGQANLSGSLVWFFARSVRMLGPSDSLCHRSLPVMSVARSLLLAALICIVPFSGPAPTTGSPEDARRQISNVRGGDPDDDPRPTPRAVQPVSETTSPMFWISGGLGVGSYGLSSQLEAAVQIGPNVFMVRRVATTDIFATIHGTGVLYGRGTSTMAILGGIGVARGHQQNQINEPGAGPEVPPSLGLALHGQWRVGHRGPLGLALSGFLNLNPEQSFGGLTLTVQLGHFSP
jgi:hypothetical protein